MNAEEVDALPYMPNGQFKKGVSPNPKGRPKSVRNVDSEITNALNEKVTVTEGGKRRKVTKMQAATIQLANKSASGDPRSTKMAFEMAQKAEQRQSREPDQPKELSEPDQQIANRLFARWRKIILEEGNGLTAAENHAG